MPYTPPDPGRLKLVFDLVDFAIAKVETLAREHEDEVLADIARELRAALARLEKHASR